MYHLMTETRCIWVAGKMSHATWAHMALRMLVKKWIGQMLYFHLFLRINIKSKCMNKCITVPATLSWWQLDTEALWVRERGQGNSLWTTQGGERRKRRRAGLQQEHLNHLSEISVVVPDLHLKPNARQRQLTAKIDKFHMYLPLM